MASFFIDWKSIVLKKKWEEIGAKIETNKTESPNFKGGYVSRGERAAAAAAAADVHSSRGREVGERLGRQWWRCSVPSVAIPCEAFGGAVVSAS